MSDIGRVMGKAMGLLKGKADGSCDFQNHQRAIELNGFFGPRNRAVCS